MLKLPSDGNTRLVRGKGVSQDEAEAVRYYKLALTGGRHFPNVECGLSRLYAEGKGVKRDLKKSFRYCKLALMHGDENADCRKGMPGPIGRLLPSLHGWD